ncbi:hypothetical protein [Delftia acidovorans]
MSPLKNPPSNLELANIIYFDALSNAADIATIAYVRLRESLNIIVDKKNKDLDEFIPCYLDAWTVVDSIDRFLELVKKNKKRLPIKNDSGLEKLTIHTSGIRELRNVADHIAQRIDRLASKKASAMGELSWISSNPTNPQASMKHFVYRPGYRLINTETKFQLPPSGQKIETPIGSITLQCESKAQNLSNAFIALVEYVKDIEILLAEHYSSKDFPKPHPRGLLVALHSAQ